jgi:ABC-type sulfate/molybdate transport systems ATPase subunit
MTALSVDRLTKRFGAVAAVNGISFSVEPGEFISLLGPSGCGKTTTLRCIAGFEQANWGRITLDGKVLADPERGIFVPPNKRHFGMVFQSYAVWPHMTVFDNVAYPLQVKSRLSRSEVRERVDDKLRTVGLSGFEARYPNQLSGGQQQRVALARALVMEPRALLFDEPLSNLDAKLRERMRFELIEIQSKLAIPAVYVTHDQAEAMVMSRRVIVMDRGSIAQMGALRGDLCPPQDAFRGRLHRAQQLHRGGGSRSPSSWRVAGPMRVRRDALRQSGCAQGRRAGRARGPAGANSARLDAVLRPERVLDAAAQSLFPGASFGVFPVSRRRRRSARAVRRDPGEDRRHFAYLHRSGGLQGSAARGSRRRCAPRSW